MKRFWILLVFVMLMLASCSSSDKGEENNKGNGSANEDGYHTVTVLATEGIRVTSENPLKVKDGERAVFTVENDNNIAIQNISEGRFNYADGTLTVDSVRSDMRISLEGERVDSDTSVICQYKFMGASYDTSSKRSGSISLGVKVTVNAGFEARSFVGWSVGATLENGGRLISSDKSYSFRISEDMINDGVLFLYSNYTDANVLYYDPNGGQMNSGTENIENNTYYTLDVVNSLLKVRILSEYYDAAGCAATFYDDGTFTRDGYVLKEYNTAADGSGEGYSLGSKFPLNLDTCTLYCIWSPDTAHSDFEYEDIKIPLPEGVSAAMAPHWCSDGIVITKYNGDDKTVTVPETIDGKTVTAIASGAFQNKSLETLVLSRRIIRIEDGAFVGCRMLKTIYYPDGIYDITNDAFDKESFVGVKNFYVNATLAPRFSKTLEGAYALKFTRLLANSDRKRVIVIAGSSAFQGLSSEYLEALLDGEYCVVNFGTTRTTQGYMYLEAMGYYADEEDIVLFAPENSAYMMGERRLYWKTLRDMEGMYNIFRHIDISGYDNVLGAFAEFNKGDPDTYEPNRAPRYQRGATRYEDNVKVNNINAYGEYQLSSREGYVNDSNYQDVYVLTLNNRFKSIKEGSYLDSDPTEDYYTSENWCDITEPYYKDNMNRAITAAKSGGAKVYFSYCPIDAMKLSAEAKAGGYEWFRAYDRFILDNYVFDGAVGKVENYIYHHKYFYNNAFHPNDYGRTYRTYSLYCDLAELLGVKSIKGVRDLGTEFEGCLFEKTADGKPLYKIDEYLK